MHGLYLIIWYGRGKHIHLDIYLSEVIILNSSRPSGVGNITIIGSDNGLSPGQCKAIIWTSAGIFLIWTLGTNFNEISIKFHTFSFKKMHWKMSAILSRPRCFMITSAHLTHLPRVPHICVSELCQHWFRWWLVAWSVPSHYLNQCWLIVSWTLTNKFQLDLNWNVKLFLHENALENIICEMAAILSRWRSDNDYIHMNKWEHDLTWYIETQLCCQWATIFNAVSDNKVCCYVEYVKYQFTNYHIDFCCCIGGMFHRKRYVCHLSVKFCFSVTLCSGRPLESDVDKLP